MRFRALPARLLLATAAACGAPPEPPPPPVRVQDCVANPACGDHLVAAHSANVLFGPPNSPLTYRTSIAHGAHLLETDVRITRDGVAVLLHDDELEKSFVGCSGSVKASTLEEVRRCRFAADSTGLMRYDGKAYPGEQVMTLLELVALAAGRSLVVAEIKQDPDNAAARAILDAKLVDRVLFLADVREAGLLRALSPNLWLVLRSRDAAEVDAALAANDPRVVVFHGDQDWTTPEVVARIHASGRKVWINTFSNVIAGADEMFNDAELCSGWWAKGFDIVQTNRADLCVPAAARK